MTNKTQNPNTPIISKWMKDHLAQNVMQEQRETFNTSDPKKWIGISTPGLVVDIEKQTFELTRGGKTITGDLYAWLSKVKGYPFNAPIGKPSISRILNNRQPDQKRKTQPAQVAKKKQQDDFHYPDNAMDEDQTKAFELAHAWIEKCFSMSSSEIQAEINKTPQRFKQVMDLRVEKCASCEAPFNWKIISTWGYAQEDTKQPDIIFECDDANFSAAVYTDYKDPDFFYDIDFVICEQCARVKYARRYEALRLMRRSASRREAAREREKRQRDHEAWVIEERERERAEAREDQAWWEGEQARRMAESGGERVEVARGETLN